MVLILILVHLKFVFLQINIIRTNLITHNECPIRLRWYGDDMEGKNKDTETRLMARGDVMWEFKLGWMNCQMDTDIGLWMCCQSEGGVWETEETSGEGFIKASEAENLKIFDPFDFFFSFCYPIIEVSYFYNCFRNQVCQETIQTHFFLCLTGENVSFWLAFTLNQPWCFQSRMMSSPSFPPKPVP